MMPKPKELYWIEIERGQGPKIGYGKRGGGKYTDYEFAKSHLEALRNRGVKCKLFGTKTNWQEIDV